MPKVRVAAHIGANKERPQLREKSWGQVHKDQFETMETLPVAYGLLFDTTIYGTHSRDFLRARFIPTFLIGHLESIASLVRRRIHFRLSERSLPE